MSKNGSDIGNALRAYSQETSAPVQNANNISPTSDWSGASANTGANNRTSVGDALRSNQQINVQANKNIKFNSSKTQLSADQQQEGALHKLISLLTPSAKRLYERNERFLTESNLDTLVGQFRANRISSRMSLDASRARAQYLDNPTEENRIFADKAQEAVETYWRNNQAALDDTDGKALNVWLKDIANQIPQKTQQFTTSLPLIGAEAGVKMGAAAATGAGIGELITPIPGVDGAIGGIVGGVIGGVGAVKEAMVAGSGVYSYSTMRGSAFNTLIDAGCDEWTAREMANDEALISSIIEMADTGLNLALWFGDKIGIKIPETTISKILDNEVVKYFVDAGGEYKEEYLQEWVSQANVRRLVKGEVGSGVFGLLDEMGQMIGNKTEEEKAAEHEAGMGGLRVGLMGGGLNAAINHTSTKILVHNVSDNFVNEQTNNIIESMQNGSKETNKDIKTLEDIQYLANKFNEPQVADKISVALDNIDAARLEQNDRKLINIEYDKELKKHGNTEDSVLENGKKRYDKFSKFMHNLKSGDIIYDEYGNRIGMVTYSNKYGDVVIRDAGKTYGAKADTYMSADLYNKLAKAGELSTTQASTDEILNYRTTREEEENNTRFYGNDERPGEEQKIIYQTLHAKEINVENEVKKIKSVIKDIKKAISDVEEDIKSNSKKGQNTKWLERRKAQYEKMLAEQQRIIDTVNHALSNRDLYLGYEKNNFENILKTYNDMDEDNESKRYARLIVNLKYVEERKKAAENSKKNSSKNYKTNKFTKSISLGKDRVEKLNELRKNGVIGKNTTELLLRLNDDVFNEIRKSSFFKDLTEDGMVKYSKIDSVINEYINKLLKNSGITKDELISQLSNIKNAESGRFKLTNSDTAWIRFSTFDESGNKDAISKDNDITYKIYAAVKNIKDLNADNISSIMKALSDAGFKGALKVTGGSTSLGDRINAIANTDQIVIHGATEQDQQIAYEVLAKMDIDLSYLGGGLDTKYGSFTQTLADNKIDEIYNIIDSETLEETNNAEEADSTEEIENISDSTENVTEKTNEEIVEELDTYNDFDSSDEEDSFKQRFNQEVIEEIKKEKLNSPLYGLYDESGNDLLEKQKDLESHFPNKKESTQYTMEENAKATDDYIKLLAMQSALEKILNNPEDSLTDISVLNSDKDGVSHDRYIGRLIAAIAKEQGYQKSAWKSTFYHKTECEIYINDKHVFVSSSGAVMIDEKGIGSNFYDLFSSLSDAKLILGEEEIIKYAKDHGITVTTDEELIAEGIKEAQKIVADRIPSYKEYIENGSNIEDEIDSIHGHITDKNTSSDSDISDENNVYKFRGEYEFLSNMSDSEIDSSEGTYHSAEAAFQAGKLPRKDRAIMQNMSGKEARQYAREHNLNFKNKADAIKRMQEVLYRKFENEELQQKLLATEDKYLEEGNTWGDTFWGTVDGFGDNILGKILMNIRAELRGDEAPYSDTLEYKALTNGRQIQMNKSYGISKRGDIRSSTTFEAVVRGERTATTRDSLQGHLDFYKGLKRGDYIEIRDSNGKVAVVQITRGATNLTENSDAYEWSKKEGWDTKSFKKYVLDPLSKTDKNGKKVEVIQIEYKYVGMLKDTTAKTALYDVTQEVYSKDLTDTSKVSDEDLKRMINTFIKYSVDDNGESWFQNMITAATGYAVNNRSNAEFSMTMEDGTEMFDESAPDNVKLKHMNYEVDNDSNLKNSTRNSQKAALQVIEEMLNRPELRKQIYMDGLGITDGSYISSEGTRLSNKSDTIFTIVSEAPTEIKNNQNNILGFVNEINSKYNYDDILDFISSKRFDELKNDISDYFGYGLKYSEAKDLFLKDNESFSEEFETKFGNDTNNTLFEFLVDLEDILNKYSLTFEDIEEADEYIASNILERDNTPPRSEESHPEKSSLYDISPDVSDPSYIKDIEKMERDKKAIAEGKDIKGFYSTDKDIDADAREPIQAQDSRSHDVQENRERFNSDNKSKRESLKKLIYDIREDLKSSKGLEKALKSIDKKISDTYEEIFVESKGEYEKSLVDELESLVKDAKSIGFTSDQLMQNYEIFKETGDYNSLEEFKENSFNINFKDIYEITEKFISIKSRIDFLIEEAQALCDLRRAIDSAIETVGGTLIDETDSGEVLKTLENYRENGDLKYTEQELSDAEQIVKNNSVSDIETIKEKLADLEKEYKKLGFIYSKFIKIDKTIKTYYSDYKTDVGLTANFIADDIREGAIEAFAEYLKKFGEHTPISSLSDKYIRFLKSNSAKLFGKQKSTYGLNFSDEMSIKDSILGNYYDSFSDSLAYVLDIYYTLSNKAVLDENGNEIKKLDGTVKTEWEDYINGRKFKSDIRDFAFDRERYYEFKKSEENKFGRVDEVRGTPEVFKILRKSSEGHGNGSDVGQGTSGNSDNIGNKIDGQSKKTENSSRTGRIQKRGPAADRFDIKSALEDKKNGKEGKLSFYDVTGKKVGNIVEESDYTDESKRIIEENKSVPGLRKTTIINGCVTMDGDTYDGMTILMRDGSSIVIISQDSDKSVSNLNKHERSHIIKHILDLYYGEDSTNREMATFVLSLMGKKQFNKALSAVEESGYLGNVTDCIEEMFCNIISGTDSYGIKFSEYTEKALSDSEDNVFMNLFNEASSDMYGMGDYSRFLRNRTSKFDFGVHDYKAHISDISEDFQESAREISSSIGNALYYLGNLLGDDLITTPGSGQISLNKALSSYYPESRLKTSDGKYYFEFKLTYNNSVWIDVFNAETDEPIFENKEGFKSRKSEDPTHQISASSLISPDNGKPIQRVCEQIVKAIDLYQQGKSNFRGGDKTIEFTPRDFTELDDDYFDNIEEDRFASPDDETIKNLDDLYRNAFGKTDFDEDNASKEEIRNERRKVYGDPRKEGRTEEDVRVAVAAEEAEIQRRSDAQKRLRAIYSDMFQIMNHPTTKAYFTSENVKTVVEMLKFLEHALGKYSEQDAGDGLTLMWSNPEKFDKFINDPVIQEFYEYDEQLKDMVIEVMSIVGVPNLNQLDTDSLVMLSNVFGAIATRMRDATTTELDGRRILRENLATSLKEDISNARGTTKNGFTKAAGYFVMRQLRPETFLDFITGFKKDSYMSKYYDKLNQAEISKLQIIAEANSMFDHLLKNRKEYKRFVSQKIKVTIPTINGNKEIEIPMSFALWLRGNLRNHDSRRHMIYHGFTLPGIDDYNSRKNDNGYGYKATEIVGWAKELDDLDKAIKEAEKTKDQKLISEAKKARNKRYAKIEWLYTKIYSEIGSKMNDYDRDYEKTSREFFEKWSRDIVNRASINRYGYEVATVDKYFPIVVDENITPPTMAGQKESETLVLQRGIINNRKYNANARLKAMSIEESISNYLNQMASFATTDAVVEDISRAMKTPVGDDENSPMTILQKKVGDKGVRIFNDLLGDLGGVPRQNSRDSMFKPLRLNMQRAVLGLNPRVMLAQTPSYLTALPELDKRSLMKALKNAGRNEKVLEWEKYDQKAENAILLQLRSGTIRKGFAETADIAYSPTELVMSKAKRLLDKTTAGISFMDYNTVKTLRYATEYWVQDNLGLKPGDYGYYDAVLSKYNDVIQRTQPNFTILQRSDLLRDPNELTKAITMFMTQRNQNFNIIYDSVARLMAYKSDYKNNKNNVTYDDVRNAGIKASKSMAGVVSATAMIVTFQMLADMMMHRVDRYRDKDEELTAESISVALVNGFANSAASNMVFGSEIYEMIYKAITGEKYYGISVGSIDTFNEMASYLTGTLTAVRNYNEAKREGQDQKIIDRKQKAIFNNMKKSAAFIGQALGIPTDNAYKIVEGFVLHSTDAINKEFGSFEAGIERTETQNKNILAKAFLKGDTKREERAVKGIDEDRLSSVVGSIAKDQMVKGNYGQEEARNLLLKYSGKYTDDIDQQIREYGVNVDYGFNYDDVKEKYINGEIDRDTVTDILTNYGEKDETSIAEKLVEYDFEKEYDVAYKDMGKLYRGEKPGKPELSREDAIAWRVKHGSQESSAEAWVKAQDVQMATGYEYESTGTASYFDSWDTKASLGTNSMYDKYIDQFKRPSDFGDLFNDLNDASNLGYSMHSNMYTEYKGEKRDITGKQLGVITILNDYIDRGIITPQLARAIWTDYYAYSTYKNGAIRYLH